MDNTPNLNLPYISAAQAQKHVTHNEAIRTLDSLVQLSVQLVSSTPPDAPSNGERYIVASQPTGEWVGQENTVAVFQDNVWTFLMPRDGWVAYNMNNDVLMVFKDSAWNPIPTGAQDGGGSTTQNQTNIFGINTTADTINRLSVASASSLFSHDGSDHRMAINRGSSSDQASILLQTNFVADTELSLSDAGTFELKTRSTTGQLQTVLQSKPGTGALDFPLQPAGKVSGNFGFLSIDTDLEVIPFNVIVFDRHGDFDITNHSFTASQSGLYLVTANIFLFAGSSMGRLAFAVNGGLKQETIRHFDGLSALNMIEILNLNAGDRVDLRTSTAHGVIQMFGYASNFAFVKIA